MFDTWLTPKETREFFDISVPKLRNLDKLGMIISKDHRVAGKLYYVVLNEDHIECKKTFYVNCIPASSCCKRFKCKIPDLQTCNICMTTAHNPCSPYRTLFGRIVCYKCMDRVVYKRLERLIEEFSRNDLNIHKDQSSFTKDYVLSGMWGPKICTRMTAEIKYLSEFKDININKLNPLRDKRYLMNTRHFKEIDDCFNGKDKWPWTKDKAARVIQRGMHDWLWKPVTRDGKVGLMPMRIAKEIGVRF